MQNIIMLYAPIGCFLIWMGQRYAVMRLATAEGGAVSAWPERFSLLVKLGLIAWVVVSLIYSELAFTDLLFIFTLFLAAVLVISRFIWRSETVGIETQPLFLDSLARDYGPILILIMAVRSFVVEPFTIPSSSMSPTLEVGDFIIVNKFKYGLRLPITGAEFLPISDPAREDIVVFKKSGNETTYIKRIVGTPGDVIEYREKILYLNGQKAQYTNSQRSESDLPSGGIALVKHEQVAGRGYRVKISENGAVVNGTWTVPAGHYFVMGDNRDNSADSREWGFVKRESIYGKAIFRWMHYDQASGVSFSTVSNLYTAD